MDWFSFIAGALTGWIVEWLIDLFYWRRKQSRWANEHNHLQADLTQSQTTVSGLRAREVELNQQLAISAVTWRRPTATWASCRLTWMPHVRRSQR